MKKYINKAKSIFNKSIRSKLDSRFILNYKGKGVINFIDVGSVGGLPEPWDANAKLVKFLLNFEPNEALQQGENYMTYNTAVWEKEETLPFYIYKGFKGTGSSLFEQNFDYVKEHFEELQLKGPARLANTWFERSELIRTTQLKCRTIDSVLMENFQSVDFHFMKIDAQGAELNILKGAEHFLKSCVGLHLELFSIPMYKNIALIDEVEAYLLNFGFTLVKKFPAHGTFHSQNDCVFLKNEPHPIVTPLIKKVYNLD